jgi:hypothetical protein
MPQVKYANHVALRDKIKRLSKADVSCLKSYSALATLCFDTALKNNGYLPKEAYYGTQFEKKGVTYKEWIEQLKKAGIFSSYKDEDKIVEKSDWIRFRPGPVTLPYINKEKTQQEELASMRDLREVESRLDEKKADRSDLDETKARLEETSKAIAKIADAVRDLQEAVLPPDSEEKKRRRERAIIEIARQSKAN